MIKFSIGNNKPIEVRHAILNDAESLQRNCLPKNSLEEVRGFLKKDVEETKKGNKARLVAAEDGEVVGNIEIFFSSHPLMHHIADISTVIVNKRVRKKGIATKLIEVALNLAREKNIEIVKISVESKNTPALMLYMKIGFKEYGRLARGLIRNDMYDDLVFLKKNL